MTSAAEWHSTCTDKAESAFFERGDCHEKQTHSWICVDGWTLPGRHGERSTAVTGNGPTAHPAHAVSVTSLPHKLGRALPGPAGPAGGRAESDDRGFDRPVSAAIRQYRGSLFRSAHACSKGNRPEVRQGLDRRCTRHHGRFSVQPLPALPGGTGCDDETQHDSRAAQGSDEGAGSERPSRTTEDCTGVVELSAELCAAGAVSESPSFSTLTSALPRVSRSSCDRRGP